MKKYIYGLCAGASGAVIQILFLLFAPGIDFNVYLSTAVTWIVVGLLISTCDFRLNGFLKGAAVALLVSAPSLVYTFSATVFGAVWTVVTTGIVGAAVGAVTEKLQVHSRKGK